MNNQLQNKIYDYEVNPPVEIWDKIATMLNESDETALLTSKLNNLEINPPKSAWNQIENELGKVDEVPVSKPKTFIYLFRYAAAAVAITLLVLGGIRLFNTGSGSKETAIQQKTIITSDPKSATDSNSSPATALNNPGDVNDKRDDEALEESKHTIAKIDIPAATKLKFARESYLSTPAHYIENETETKNNFPYLQYSEIFQSLSSGQSTPEDLSDRYIMLRAADGNFFRISKKLSGLICCISGEDENAVCKDQLQRWREKIASSPIAPSPGNFLDILNLISSLQEDKH
ncbi:MAG: hypothetical protein JST10_01770 [Bacteroidetes bacterium]|nr:hypothetical protein [Bacteroidota bacterium]